MFLIYNFGNQQFKLDSFCLYLQYNLFTVSHFHLNHRSTYSKMSEELCNLLRSTPAESSEPSVQMSCCEAMLSAPIPEDLRSNYLQDALSVFTYFLAEAASWTSPLIHCIIILIVIDFCKIRIVVFPRPFKFWLSFFMGFLYTGYQSKLR